MNAKAFISGCAGLRLSEAEREFFARERPWGLILFARNCDTPDQVRKLVSDFRAAVETPDAPVLIDQEGGRVQRLKPPHWPAMPSARSFGDVYATDRDRGLRLARAGARLLAHDLLALGITVDCLPVADVPQRGAHDIIGDRAYGETVDQIVALARAASEGLLDGGVLPVMKHIPGHGRAAVDSHVSLPRVDADLATLEETDFAPFRALRDLPMAMTAHVVYSALDPELPATQSPRVIERVIRGTIGFDGLLMSDDLSMGALAGNLATRARRAIDAGCDVALHCNGALDEMREVAHVVPWLEGRAADRAAAALAQRGAPAACDVAALREEISELC